MGKRVIIPSAIYVPEELQGIGKLPAIIYPVNEEIVFDILYRQYVDNVNSLDVICYEGIEKVHRRLKSKVYLPNKVNIIELSVLKDLGYSVYTAIEKNRSLPIIINFSDTIVMEDILQCPSDSFYYHEDDPSNRWTFFEEEDGIITKIYDKTISFPPYARKLFVGVFQIEYTADFIQCLEITFAEGDHDISAFYYALMLYSRMHPMKPIYTKNWFDVGHLDRYCESRLGVKARTFNHITIDSNRGILKKTSENKEKFIGEILWYLKLPADVEYVRPRIFSYSTSYINPYIKMEYYSYHTLHELFLYGDLNRHQWRDIFRRIRFICDDFRRYQVSGEDELLDAQRQIYLKKTMKRLQETREREEFMPFFTSDFTINDIDYISLDEIIRKLETSIPSMLYSTTSFCIIHGDLCFSNIMVDNNYSFIKVVDPRGEFGGYDIYGDPRYEMAKLFHSIEGKYDFIIKDLFELEVNLMIPSVSYKINDRVCGFDLMDVFISVFADDIGGKTEEIRLIEALLFLSMIPLHNESKQHQYVMFATGIELLGNIISIRK